MHVLVTGSDYLVLRGGDLIRDEVPKDVAKLVEAAMTYAPDC